MPDHSVPGKLGKLDAPLEVGWGSSTQAHHLLTSGLLSGAPDSACIPSRTKTYRPGRIIRKNPRCSVKFEFQTNKK